MTRTKPTSVLMMAKPGVDMGLCPKLVTVDQSKVKEPIPRPRIPEPSCCTSTESFQIKQRTEMADIEGAK